MNTFKKIVLCVVFVFSLSLILASCNANNQMPENKPSDFNFVLNYGVEAKNQLDTQKEMFTKDMVMDPSVTTTLKLTDEEMDEIYTLMKNINILNYPDNFNPFSNSLMTPYSTYSFKIIVNGKEKNINWKDESGSNNKEAVDLRNLIKRIQEIIYSKDEYKKLPEAKGGYV